jgi:hypothetical protein
MSLTFHAGLLTIATMRTRSIPHDGPLCLRLAADARLCIPDYADDQIWELKVGGGEPPALALETTYGLRARGMRIFPSFFWGSRWIMDPKAFSSPPIFRSLLPNYLKVEFNPFPDLQVVAEYWVPDSHTVAGRFTLTNFSSETVPLRLRLHAVLRPGENPRSMGETTIEGAHVLAGHTSQIEPVVFLGGAAMVEEVVYPALAIHEELHPGRTREITWGHAGLASQQDSFSAARATASRAWDAEIARLEMVNASQVEIETGDAEWDAAFVMAQNAALRGYVGPTPRLPHASFVLTRTPDRGYSERGDGKDYGLDWDGQTAAHAYVNLAQILPAAPELAKGVIRNFLAVQKADGGIDWKPGLGGQRNGCLCIPLLASLTWKIYRQSEDRTFLEETVVGLLEFLEAWFHEGQDRDSDGHPEWEHVLQSAFDDWPTFVPWREWGQGLKISMAETQDLASYLYRECQSLILIAEELDRPSLVPALRTHMERLAESVEASWSEDEACYQHRDRDHHVSPKGDLLGQGRGSFRVDVGRDFDHPVRVLVRVQGPEGAAQKLKATLRGRSVEGGRRRVFHLQLEDFQWFWERGAATSSNAFHSIKNIEIENLSDEFSIDIWTADFTRQDQTLLLPLWAGIPDAQRVEHLVQETLLDPKRFWRTYGIPSCSADDPAFTAGRSERAGAVGMLWNTMICEGLIDHGYTQEAVELVSRLMGATIHSLRRDNAFRESYDPDKAQAFGDRGHLWGTAPVHLFLQTLGVRLLSANKIELRAGNPYPWPVMLRWRGVEIRYEKDQCMVTFPNGHQEMVEGEGVHLVEQAN